MVELRAVSLEAALINGKGRCLRQQASLIVASKLGAYDWKLICQEKRAHKYGEQIGGCGIWRTEEGGCRWVKWVRRIQSYMK